MCFFFFHETIAYLKGNSKIKEKFFKENAYTEVRKTYFLAPKLGVDLYTGKYGIVHTLSRVQLTHWKIPDLSDLQSYVLLDRVT